MVLPLVSCATNSGALRLYQSQASSHTRSVVVHHTLPTSGCLYTANPGPRLGSNLQSPSLTPPAPADECLRLGSAARRGAPGGGHQPSVQQASLHLSPADWLKLFLFHSSLPRVQVPSYSFLSFFFCPTQLHGDFLALVEV